MSGGFGLALIVFAESFSIASRFARQHGYEVDADQEMIGMGAANAAAGLFRGFAVSGSTSRTAAVEGAGGGSQMVSLIAAVLVLVTAAFLTPLFTDLPEPVLGAIVIVAVRGFLRTEPLRRYWRLDRRSFWTATTALLGTLVFDLLPGLLIAVALSLVWFIGAASRPRLAVLGQLGGGRYGDLLDHPGAGSRCGWPGSAVAPRPNSRPAVCSIGSAQRTCMRPWTTRSGRTPTATVSRHRNRTGGPRGSTACLGVRFSVGSC